MSFDEVFIATKNKGKIKEFVVFFAEKGVAVRSLLDLEEEIDVVEDGTTFEENARKKAEEIGRMINKVVIADDSGLEVDALNGEPGIYSARYAGADKSDAANNEKLLRELSHVEGKDRSARFVCALAMYVPGKGTKALRGTCDGVIAMEAKGSNGFGYDPLFYIPSINKTMAELTEHEKNKISHRANALLQLEQNWDEWLTK